LIDYAPASLIYSYLEKQDNPYKDKRGFFYGTGYECLAPSSGGLADLWGTPVRTMVSWAWWEDKPHDFVCLLTGTFFTIVVPSRQTDARYTVPDINRYMFQTWWDYGETGRKGPAVGWSGNDGYTVGGTKLSVLPVHPATWPDVSVRIRHYAANARQFHSATILNRSPLTGQVFKLFFTFTGTTLRGARMQRGLDGASSAP
jgi:hypothetical protein